METTISNRFSKAYVEVLEIVKHMEKTYQNKIPKKLLDMFENKKDKNYEYHIDSDKNIKEQELLKETIGILSVLEIQYWANPEEKQILKESLIYNENKYQEELKQKYNPDNVFKNRTRTKEIQDQKTQNNQIQNEKYLVEIRENFFYRLMKKIKNIFKFKN